MNYLSQRAKQYLQKQERNTDYIIDSDELVEAFLKQDIDFSDEVYDAQMKYSGYLLSIIGDDCNDFYFYLIDSVTKPIDCVEEGGTSYFYISRAHRTAQFSFYLSNKGAIVTLGPETDGQVVIVYKSVKSMIEDYAYRNEISQQGFEHGGYHPIKDEDKLIKYLKNNALIVDSNTDNLNHYFRMDDFVINITRSLNDGKPLLTMYQKNKSSKEKDLLIELAPYLGQ